MNHPVETFGFRVEQAGRALAYSADTGTCPALVELASQADVLLCEASFLTGPDPMPDMHLTARGAAEHAAAAGVGRLVLTHLVPWNDRAADPGGSIRLDLRRPDLACRAGAGHRAGLGPTDRAGLHDR